MQASLAPPRGRVADAGSPTLTAEDLLAAAAWLQEHHAELPAAVARLAQAGLTCATGLANPALKIRQLLLQLRRALGITPSSEKTKKSGRPLDGLPSGGGRQRMTEKERLEHEYARLGKLLTWHRGLVREKRARQKKVGERLKTLERLELELEDETPPTAEERAAEAAQVAAEMAEYEARLAEGQRCDLDCAETTETMMVGCTVAEHRDDVACEVGPAELPRNSVVLKRFSETRERIDVKLHVSTLDISVEKVLVQTGSGQQLISASVNEIGPPRMRVTWNFLVNLAMLAAGQCIPFNRFALLASTSRKRFTAGEIGRYFVFTAEHFMPVYCALARGLANAEVLSGDDTPTRVIEVARALEAAKDEPVPWHSFATQAHAKLTAAMAPSPSLSVRLAQILGFAFPRKSDNAHKRGFNTTVLSGRQHAHDPRSAIVFYRSHLGSLGNLLDVVLPHRDPAKRALVIQSDLSTTNLISNPELAGRFDVSLAGCSSHARRPFALHADADPEICDWILHAFKGLALYERSLSFHGRNHENTRAVRGIDGRQLWDDIRNCSELLIKRWSRQTPLGEGARYVLRHYDRLTYYLDDPRLSSSNNFSERMLRMEKLIQNNALFRQTLNGRFALDIMRTVLQTAIAARVDPQAYLLWVLRMPPDVVASAPEQFTPLAFARCCTALVPDDSSAYVN
jgi:hypothetical protein